MREAYQRFSRFLAPAAAAACAAALTWPAAALRAEPVPPNPATHPPAAKPAPPAPQGDAPQTADDGTIRAAGIAFAPPKAWRKEAPSSPMRAAQFAVPDPADAAKSAGSVVFFTKIGGSVDDNINRWIAQMSDVTRGPEREVFEAAGALKVHSVLVVGTFTDTMRADGPKKNSMLLGAVVTGGPEGPVFIKATGTEAALGAQAEAWKAMLKSAKAG